MRRGYIDEAQLDAALAEQSVDGKPLGRVLVDNGAISAAALAAALAEQQGVTTTAQAIWEAAQHDSEPGQPLYEIRESVGSIAGPLYVGSSLLDTTDVAFAVLQELDPQRLLVVQTERGRDVHVVWQYPVCAVTRSLRHGLRLKSGFRRSSLRACSRRRATSERRSHRSSAPASAECGGTRRS